MKTILLMSLILLWSHNVSAKEWSEREKQLFAAYGVLIATDIAQTRSARRNPCQCYSEGNPVYGKYASDEELIVFNVLAAWSFYRLVEKDAPDWLLYTAVGVRGAIVISNHSIGVRFKHAF